MIALAYVLLQESLGELDNVQVSLDGLRLDNVSASYLGLRANRWLAQVEIDEAIHLASDSKPKLLEYLGASAPSAS